ncbi:hypothetical protein SAMN05519104_3398 [Rhizobiales bacterium GAS188]|nr:hypothetical protein SAMN05519104_3398 [Rhizobiales bacterium GAS188]
MPGECFSGGRGGIERRAVLGGAVAVAATAVFPAAAQQGSTAGGGDLFAYVGSYTSASKGHGEGIALLRVEPRSGALTPVKTFPGASPPGSLSIRNAASSTSRMRSTTSMAARRAASRRFGSTALPASSLRSTP